MKLKYFGHSTFLVTMNGKNLLFDPFITGNPTVEDKDISQIKADYMLISHGHADHVADAEAIANNNDLTLISNYEITTWFGEKGLNGHPINHGGKAKFDFGTVKYVNAVHTSVLPDGSNGGQPGGFVIWDDNSSFYFAGDTGLTLDMKLIPMTCPKLDYAILPIGDNFTMGYDDATIAAEFIQCDKIVACHFDTFGYIKIDQEAAKAAFAAKGKELIIMDQGSTIEL